MFFTSAAFTTPLTVENRMSWLERGHLHTFFTGRISIHGRCHGLPRLNELSGVELSCFTFPRQTSRTEVLLSLTGRLAYIIVRGNCLLKVMGQEKCDYMFVLPSSIPNKLTAVWGAGGGRERKREMHLC